MPPVFVLVHTLLLVYSLIVFFLFRRLSAVKLASINIACMMVDNSSSGAAGEGEERKAGADTSEAKAALHAVMLHFLTSSSL